MHFVESFPWKVPTRISRDEFVTAFESRGGFKLLSSLHHLK